MNSENQTVGQIKAGIRAEKWVNLTAFYILIGRGSRLLVDEQKSSAQVLPFLTP